MNSRKKQIFLCAAVVLLGSVFHFLYDWFPCLLTALFAPVNESLWEHLKIFFFPCLIGFLLLTKGRKDELAPYLWFLPWLCGLMLAAAWGYHITLGGDALWVDLLLFAVLVVLAFLLPAVFPNAGGRLWPLTVLLNAGLCLAIWIFTFAPPDHLLFADLSKADFLFPPCLL